MLAKTAIDGASQDASAGPPVRFTRRMLIAGAGALALAGPRVAQAAPRMMPSPSCCNAMSWCRGRV
ncbi:MAG: hypothetical protein HPM95_01345 [Alphaproteobacteria bacterium]|nr:hypothetical protein [Alphaproteobacteria bacterium]